MSVPLNQEIARRFIRLVLVAEVESRADQEDWDLAYGLAEQFGMPRPGDDISKANWDYYWPG